MSATAIDGDVAVRLAQDADHDGIAAVLSAPMAERWGLAWRLPGGLAAACAAMGERWQAVVAERGGRVIACGFRFVRRMRCRGEPALLGYLAWLRRDPSLTGFDFIRVLKRAMPLLRAQRRADELPWDLTGIIDGNDPARRLLERGLPGMPRYHRIGSYRSHLFATRRLRRGAGGEMVRWCSGDDPAVGVAIAAANAASDLHGTRMPGAIAVLPGATGGVRACLGAEDLRPVRQLVLTAAPTPVRALRPLLNLGRSALGQPLIPPPGRALALWHGAAAALPDRDAARALLAAVARRAHAAGVDGLLVGAAAGTPLDQLWQNIGPAHRTSTWWYAVTDADRSTPVLRYPHQDVAML